VPGARWRPEYDLDFTPDGDRAAGPGRARLTVSAVIEQSTGEDWRDVTLALSTAKPRLGASAPQPAPMFLGGYEETKGKVLVEQMEKRTRLERGGAGTGGGAQQVSLEDRGQAVVLEVPRKVSVEADGRPYWIPVDSISALAKSGLVAAPKLKPHVFQLVKLENPAPYPLLAGTVHCYRRGAYVGDTSIEYRGRGEPMEISLGIDERVKVARKELNNLEKRAAIFSSTRKIEHAWRIELTSRSQTEVGVEVRDNLPVSKIEDVEVKLDEKATSAGYQLDKERGFVTWTKTLAAGKTAAVDLVYTIRLPDDWQVNLQ
jgi:uncharacterized protein (TIGR02231 family)